MKLFGKSLLIYSLIFSLMNISFISMGNGIILISTNNAYAQTAEERRAAALAGQAAADQQNRDSAQTLSNSENNVITKKTVYDGNDGDRGDVVTADWLSTMTMLVIGFVASYIARYKWTADIGVAIAGGVAYIGGEIYALFKYKDFNKQQIDKVLEYEKRSDGTFDDSQIAAFEEQKKAYENARNTAKMKSLLQTAAWVAFTTAAAISTFKAGMLMYHKKICENGIKAAGRAGLFSCKTSCAGLESVATCINDCGECVKDYALLERNTNYITAHAKVIGRDSGTSFREIYDRLLNHEYIEGAKCTPFTETASDSSNISEDDNKENNNGNMLPAASLKKLVVGRPYATKVHNDAVVAAGLKNQASFNASGSPVNLKNTESFNLVASPKVQAACAGFKKWWYDANVSMLEGVKGSNIKKKSSRTSTPILKSLFGADQLARYFRSDLGRVKKLLIESFPEASKHFNESQEVIKKLESLSFKRFSRLYENSYHFVYDEAFSNSQNEFQAYLLAHEQSQLASGAVQSISLNQYDLFQKNFSADGNDWEIKETLKIAARKGIDLIMPNAHAFTAQALGLAGIAGAIFYSTSRDVLGFLDPYMVMPGSRALIFGAMALLAYNTSSKTEEIADKMDENSKKIDSIIKDMRRLAEGRQIVALSGTRQELNRRDARLVVASAGPLSSDGKPLDCAIPGSNGSCGSLKSAIVTSQGFSSISSGIGQVASLSGSVADGFAGQSNVTAATLGQAATLANQKNAVRKQLREERKKLNTLRQEAGQAPIPFETLTKNLAKGVQRFVAGSLRKKGIKSSEALAKMPIISPSDLSTGKAKPKIAKSAALKRALPSSFSKKGGFDFKFEEAQKEEVPLNASDLIETDTEIAGQLAELSSKSEQGIVNNPNASIFNVISVRYLKSGFDRLFEVEKPSRESEEEPKGK